MDSERRDITFYLWADTHFGYDQSFGPADFRWDIIRQMSKLSGWPYPEEVGGCVDAPAFVMHCGDMLDAEKDGAYELAVYRYFLADLHIPHYETLGNHDTSKAFSGYFRDKYGGNSYSFDMNGIHFISLGGQYNAQEVGTIPDSQIRFLGKDIKALDADTPIVLFTHSRLDRVTNGAHVVRLLKQKRPILVASGHLHRPSPFLVQGILGIDIGHCRNHPNDLEWGRSFTVVRIKGNTLTAVPWRWDLKDWEKGQRQSHYPTIHRAAVVNRRI